MTLRVLIVDDEPLACEGMRRLLEKSEGIEIVGECSDGVQAIEAIHSIRPDLVFLDIQMPEVNGFDVIEQIGPATMPSVIFVTAYDEFALKAFNVHALDYLLKPVDPARLAQSVARAMSHLSGITNEGVGKKLQALLDDIGRRYPERIMIKTPGRITFLNVDEVDWIEAEGDYVCFHAGGRKHLIRDKIGEVENRLNPDLFARIHRSSIVRLARVRELQPMFSGEYTVLLTNGEKLTMSRTYRDRVLATLNQTGKHR